jgi:hypothetical protein
VTKLRANLPADPEVAALAEIHDLRSADAQVLAALRSIWPSALTVTRLAILLDCRTRPIWGALHRLARAELVETKEVVWEAKGIVYSIWRANVTPDDFAVPEAERTARPNPFIPAEREPAVTIPDPVGAS